MRCKRKDRFLVAFVLMAMILSSVSVAIICADEEVSAIPSPITFKSVTADGTELVYEVTSSVSPYTVQIGDGGTAIRMFTARTLTVPSTVTHDGVTYTVDGIRDYAFYGCSFLKSVTIPSSVTTIGRYAFGGCTSLTSVTIPSSVTTIEYGALSNCTSLTSVTIPSSVTTIESRAFSDCTSLTSVTIPSSVTTIGSGAFSDCTSLTSVTIPRSVTTIGNYAFEYCISMTSINVDASNPNYSSIDGVLFNKAGTTLICCPAGKTGSYNVPSTVTMIEYGALSNCTSLTSVTIPSSVTTIGSGAFSDCTSMTSINVDGSNPNYSSADGVLFDKAGNLLICYPAGRTGSYNIPNSVGIIEYSAFGNCTSLTSVTIPSSVTIIRSGAFGGCTSLTSVTIPSSVTTIEYRIFGDCTSLTSVTIPSSVTTIREGAFGGCTSLTSVTIPSSVTTIEDYVFEDCTSLTSINVAASNPNYSSADGVLFNKAGNMLICCPAGRVGSYSVPSGVTAIGDYAFRDCISLTSINVAASNTNYSSADGVLFNKAGTTLICCPAGRTGSYNVPSGVTTIEDNAFRGCEFITSISMPGSVTDIGNIKTWASLTNIDVDASNSNYSSIDGVLFDGSGINLINYPAGRTGSSYTVPDGVTTIGEYAFVGCTSLTSVSIPSTVTTIEDRAFSDCTSIVYLVLESDSLKYVGEGAFIGCTSLTSVSIHQNAVDTTDAATDNGFLDENMTVSLAAILISVASLLLIVAIVQGRK